MSEQIDPVELEKFNTMVDKIVDGIQSGQIKANPLEKEDITKIDTKEIRVRSTSTQKGEDEVEQTQRKTTAISAQKFTGGKVLIHNAETGELIHEFPNAAQAKDVLGLNPTTIRGYCKEGKVKDGQIWSYGG
jgi:hypothetical protein